MKNYILLLFITILGASCATKTENQKELRLKNPDWVSFKNRAKRFKMTRSCARLIYNEYKNFLHHFAKANKFFSVKGGDLFFNHYDDFFILKYVGLKIEFKNDYNYFIEFPFLPEGMSYQGSMTLNRQPLKYKLIREEGAFKRKNFVEINEFREGKFYKRFLSKSGLLDLRAELNKQIARISFPINKIYSCKKGLSSTWERVSLFSEMDMDKINFGKFKLESIEKK